MLHRYPVVLHVYWCSHIFSNPFKTDTAVNTTNGHFSMFPVRKSHISSTPLWTLVTTAFLAAHCLFPCHNHVLIAYNEPSLNNYRFVWVNTILSLIRPVFLPMFDPCMLTLFKMPATSHQLHLSTKRWMEWYTKRSSFLSDYGMKKERSWTSELSFPVLDFIEYSPPPPRELKIIIINMRVCDAGHRNVSVFHITQVNVWADT